MKRTSTVRKRKNSKENEAKPHACFQCHKGFKSDKEGLFVETEVGRVFCSEACITLFFKPEIQHLEKLYRKRQNNQNELSLKKREAFAHLRKKTLHAPDQVWLEELASGDKLYTMMRSFKVQGESIYSVCQCLFLHGEPSFLFLAFVTRKAKLVGKYQKGILCFDKLQEDAQDRGQQYSGDVMLQDGLADEWTEDETLRAGLTQTRGDHDIPFDEFSKFQVLMNDTLEAPDEVWSLKLKGKDPIQLYHFLRFFEGQEPPLWYVIVAKDISDEEDQLEILEAFPTIDPDLVERYRQGEMEVGPEDLLVSQGNRLVH